MGMKIKTLEWFFENESFKKFAPFFLDGFITVLEVETLTKIARQTISRQLEGIGDYVELQTPKWSERVKGRPLKINASIIADYFALKSKLDEHEKGLLRKIVADADINRIITKHNINLDGAIRKLIFTLLLIGIGRGKSKQKSRFSLMNLDRLFVLLFFDTSFKKKKSKEEPHQGKDFTISLIQNTLTILREEEFDRYKSSIICYMQKDDECHTFDAMFDKIMAQEFYITTNMLTWGLILDLLLDAKNANLRMPKEEKRTLKEEISRVVKETI